MLRFGRNTRSISDNRTHRTRSLTEFPGFGLLRRPVLSYVANMDAGSWDCQAHRAADHHALGRLKCGIEAGQSVAATGDGKSPISLSTETAQWIYSRSSGSTGSQKIIRRSIDSWRKSFEVNKGLFGIGPQDRYATLGDLGHSISLYAAMEALHLGASFSLLAGAPLTEQIRGLSRATLLYATPAQLRILQSRTAQLPALRLILCGGGKLDQTLRSGLAELAPNADVREFFGASETSFITLSDGSTPEGSVGKAYPGVTVDIRGGELWLKSPYLFDGYDGQGDGAIWDGDFLSIGEMAEVDASGYLTLLGRKDRMFTIADQNVYPEAIEAALQNDPLVRHAAVLARPDDLRGHHLIVVVEGAVSDETVGNVRKRFGALAVPKQVLEIDEMPLLPAGKPDLMALSRWVAAK